MFTRGAYVKRVDKTKVKRLDGGDVGGDVESIVGEVIRGST